MKKSTKGFTLIETLIVSSFVVGILVYLFSQFVVLKNGYNRFFQYNQVEGIYKAGNIDKYLSSVENVEVKKMVNQANLGYIDISECGLPIVNKEYCKTLFSTLHTKTVLITLEDLKGIKNALKNNNPYSEGLYQFVKRQKTDISGNRYRVVVEFQDNTFATLLLGI